MKAAKIIIALVLVAALAFGVYSCFTREELSLTYGGEDANGISGIIIGGHDPLVLDMDVYGNYSVKIVPTKGADFTYSTNGNNRQFNQLLDLTQGFDIREEDGQLIVTPKGSIKSLLQQIHPGVELTLNEEALADLGDLFTLVVSNSNTEYRISFGVYIYPLDGVELPGELVF